VFGALGLGMAAPFIAVAAAPGLVACLPHPGPWMIWLRRALGLSLLGTAVWLVFLLALEAGTGVSLLTCGMLAVLLTALAWRRRLPSGRRERCMIETVAMVLAAAVVLVPSLQGQTASVAPVASSRGTGLWHPFDESALSRMVGDGKIVLVDVTAVGA
jgi:suppressor for copper-sensitivity B